MYESNLSSSSFFSISYQFTGRSPKATSSDKNMNVIKNKSRAVVYVFYFGGISTLGLYLHFLVLHSVLFLALC